VTVAGISILLRIVQFSNQLNENSINKIDYFIYGHFHYPTQMKLKGGGELFILGEWINNCDYLVYDGQTIRRENLL
jgi:UDP-2,3-diacylglucosamine hydrolase